MTRKKTKILIVPSQRIKSFEILRKKERKKDRKKERKTIKGNNFCI